MSFTIWFRSEVKQLIEADRDKTALEIYKTLPQELTNGKNFLYRSIHLTFYNSDGVLISSNLTKEQKDRFNNLIETTNSKLIQLDKLVNFLSFLERQNNLLEEFVSNILLEKYKKYFNSISWNTNYKHFDYKNLEYITPKEVISLRYKEEISLLKRYTMLLI